MHAGGDCAGFGWLRCAAQLDESHARARLAGHNQRDGSNDRRSHRDAFTDCYLATDRYACARPASHNQRDGSNDRDSHRYARARLAGHNRRYGGDAGRPYVAAYRNTPADSHAPTHGHAAADGNPVPHCYPNTSPYIDSAAYSNSATNAKADRHADDR